MGYGYDEDRLTGISVSGGTAYTLTYDSFGRSAATYVGSATAGIPLAQYTYNTEGLLATLTYGNGQYASYAYDPLGRQTKVWYNGNTATTVETVYNDRGQVGLVKDPFSNTRTRYAYDLAGRLVEARRTNGAAADADSLWTRVNLLYEDGTGRLKETTVRSRVHTDTTGYVYGEVTQGQMVDAIYGVKQNGTTQVSYAYDGFGRLTTRTLNAAGWSTAYTYAPGAGSNTTSTRIATITTPDGTTAYSYDTVGNITGEQVNGTSVAAYTYDGLNQLTAATVNGVSYAYTYDTHGNILTATEGGTTHTYTYGDSVWKDKLTAYDGQTITYDAIGNPLTYRDGMTFTWQYGRQLASVTKDGVTSSYVYNADGGRHSKTVDGVTTSYYSVDGVLYALTCGSDTVVFRYDDTGRPYMMLVNGLYPLYYAYNLQGDVVGLVESSGTMVVTYTYDPWGKLLSLTDTYGANVGTLNPFRYRGYLYDTETGLYYCNTRYYDPEVGRWINGDGQLNADAVLGYNLFAYCYNSPVNKVDHGGNKPGDLFDTMDEAARDAAIYMGEDSFENGWEYITVIYSVTRYSLRFRRQVVNFSLGEYNFQFTMCIPIIIKSTFFTYRDVFTDKDPMSAKVPSAPAFKKRLGVVHTHPMGSGRGITKFSDFYENGKRKGDIQVAYNLNVIMYVYGPNGQMRRFDPRLGIDVLLYDDLPVSKKKPWLK